MRRALLLAATVAVLAGCAADSPASRPSETEPTTTAPTDTPPASTPSDPGYTPLVLDEAPDGLVDGVTTGPDGERDVVLHLPDGGGAGAPLILALHPFGFDGPQFDRLTGLGTAGAAAGAVVAFPDGIGGSWNASRSCCPPATVEEVDDVGFLTALVSDLHDQLGTDPARTSAVGFSNGGFMATRLACDTSRTVTAIVSHAASLDITCDPDAPVSVLVSHGTTDPVVPFEEARPLVDAWVELNACPAPTETDGFEQLAAPCDADTAVALQAWSGVGHAWPEALGEQAIRWVLDRGRA